MSNDFYFIMMEEISNVLFYICVCIFFHYSKCCALRVFFVFKVLHKHERDKYMSITLGYATALIAVHKLTSCNKLHDFLLLWFTVVCLPDN